MNPIKFLDLPAQHAPLADEMEAAILDVVRSGAYILGPAVSAFEAAFADYCGADEAIAVNSGTSALHLTLAAMGVGPGTR